MLVALWRNILGVDVYLRSFSNLALDRVEWSTSHPDCFIPGKNRGIRRLGGPQSWSSRSGENKNLLVLSIQYSGHAMGWMVIWEMIRERKSFLSPTTKNNNMFILLKKSNVSLDELLEKLLFPLQISCKKICKYAVSPEKGPVRTHFLSLSSTLYLYKTASRTPK